MGLQFFGERGIGERQNLRGEDGGVGGARLADRHGGHGDAGGHLHGGQQRVEALQRR